VHFEDLSLAKEAWESLRFVVETGIVEMANPDLQKSCNCGLSPCRCHFDYAGLNYESETLPSFLCKREILKMHLEILYKSIGFLCEDKIISKLDSYKLAKE
jgi:hypothetical protein